MRILVVSQYFWPEVFRVNELVEQLVHRGHEVTVLTGRPNYPEGRVFDAFAKDPQRFSSYAGAEVIRLPLRPRGQGSLRLVLNYWSFVFWGCLLGPWRLRGRAFDVIFCFETSPITSALPATLLRRIKRAPMALWVLDLWPDTLSAIGMVRSPWLLNWVGSLVAFIYRRCDLILAQSRGFFGPIERWSRDPGKTRYFPQWADGVFGAGGPPADTTPPPEMQPHRGLFTVMFAGNLGEAQDLGTVVQAAARLRHHDGLRWIILGDGRAAPALLRDIARHNLHQRMVLLGRHPLERMPQFFASADAMLVSLRREPIFAMTVPGKLQSYLAAGRPILAMLDGEGADVVKRSGAGLCCPAGDAEALAENVERLMAMAPEAREAMGRAGRAYADEAFDRDRLVTQLESWLESMPRGK